MNKEKFIQSDPVKTKAQEIMGEIQDQFCVLIKASVDLGDMLEKASKSGELTSLDECVIERMKDKIYAQLYVWVEDYLND